jgi:hypothetical protein
MQGGKNEFVHLIFCVIQWMSDPICTERKLQYERMCEWIIFVKRLYFSAISWREHVPFDEMMMFAALC